MTEMCGPRCFCFLATSLMFVSWILCASAEPVERPIFHRNSNSKCAYGQRLCPTSNECIDDFKWCNGVKDCPDDEQDCRETRPPQATSPCPVATKPICPSGQYPKLEHATRCPNYVCVPGRAEDDCRLPYNAATCVVSGNIVKTFDGWGFRHKICDHILLQDKISNEFYVKVHLRCWDRPYIDDCGKFLSIMSNDVFIELGPSLQEVKVNHVDVPTGSLQTISRRLRDVHLALSGQRLVFVSLKHKFQVVFDERRSIKIGVSECLTKSTSGLCGRFKFNSRDDFGTPDGTLEITGKAFGDSWTSASSSSCPLSNCTTGAREIARKWCRKLWEAPLNWCLEPSSMSMSFSICEDFMCDCVSVSEANTKMCMCQAVEGFVATCNAAVRQEIASHWRLSLGCECPAGMEWNNCGPAREKTCENMHDKSNVFQENCVPGCYCPIGKVRLGDSCVPPEFCHDCVCRGHGGSNYITFDGHYYNFQGNCSYVLAQHTSGNPHLDFRVIGTNAGCPEEPGLTCTQSVTVTHLGHQVRIVRGQRITVDGYELRDVDNPWNNMGFNISWVPGRSSIVFLPAINLVVRYFEVNYGFSIELPSFTYFNKTEGLCGVCNFDESDDLLHRSGQVTSDVPSFTYSWVVEGTPETCRDLKSLNTRPLPPEICQFKAAACDLYVNPEPYQKSCMNDANYSVKVTSSVCRSKLQYAEHCCSMGGIPIQPWLQNLGCKRDFVCPTNMELRCDSGCPKTCDNYKESERCPLMPTYSCFCKEGMVLKNGECVDVNRCEYCDDQGHRAGDTWKTEPCESCSCTESLEVHCSRIICPPPPTCRSDARLRHVSARNGTCCDEYSCELKPYCFFKQQQPIECGIGEVRKVETDKDGCISFVCECNHRQCPPLTFSGSLEPGFEVFVEVEGCCNKLSVRCNPILCPDPPSCPPETELKDEPGECCPTYKCMPRTSAPISTSTSWSIEEVWYDFLKEAAKIRFHLPSFD